MALACSPSRVCWPQCFVFFFLLSNMRHYAYLVLTDAHLQGLGCPIASVAVLFRLCAPTVLPFCKEQSRLGKEVDRIGDRSWEWWNLLLSEAHLSQNIFLFFLYFHCDAKHLHVLVINNFCLEKNLESCYTSNNRMTLWKAILLFWESNLYCL